MPRPFPKSIDETHQLLGSADYVADRSLATALYLSLAMQRPLFLEGEAGVGKTEIAKVIAASLGRELIRLQCYEGLDIAQAAYEWNYSRQMIEIRLAEAAGEKSKEKLSQDIFSEKFLVKRPLAARARGQGGRGAGAADRRAGPHRRALRGLPAGGALGLADHDPRNRHAQGRRAAGRGDHLQPHARDPRRGQAPLLLPLGGLPGRGARARDPAPQGAQGGRCAVQGGGGLRSAPARRGPVQAAGRGRDHRLGQLPGRAGPHRARPRDGQQHARRPAQVPGRHRAHRRRGSRAPGDRVEDGAAAA